MDYQKPEYRVGTVVLISMVVGIVFVFSISNIGKLFKRTHGYQVHFEYLDGLKENAEVYHTGFKVGMVRNIELNPNGEGGAIVKIDIDQPIQLRAEDHASISSEGLLGVKLVDIVAGPVTAKILSGEDVLHGERAPSIKEILQTANQIAGNVDSAVRVISDFLSGSKIDHSIQNTLKKIAATLDEIKHASSNIAALSDSGKQKIDRVLDRADHVMASIDGLVTRSQPKIERTIDDSSKAAHILSTRLDELSANLNQLVKRVNDLSAKKDKDFSETIDNIKKSSESLRKFSREIELSPWKLVRK